MTFKINPNSKSYRYYNERARREALRSAKYNNVYGNGSLADARERYQSFCELHPKLAKYIGAIEWMKVYRSHPQWPLIAASDARYASEARAREAASTSFGK